jgi:glycosyltransferase involved in cell wall biosynthesis
LSNYDLLLFPTRYFTEGLPGSIVDAYFAGLPVIATKWKHAEEFVIHGKTGYIVPFENGTKQMANCLSNLDLDRNLLHEFKKNALSEAQRFTSDKAWSIIYPLFN